MADKAQARLALDQYDLSLKSRKNVVGTGVLESEDGSGEAIAVYVSHKEPKADLSAEDLIPESVELATEGIKLEVPVRVFDVGGRFEREKL